MSNNVAQRVTFGLEELLRDYTAEVTSGRAEGVTVPLRVGVAGPASRTSLLKYAMICGVGASIRALTERPVARGMLAGDTPGDVLAEIAVAQAAEPALGFQGIHFFTFASLAATAKFVDGQRQMGVRA
jgi:methylenetetrahydrofolate reductase (NADPH)